jgi:hypothetical protein
MFSLKRKLIKQEQVRSQNDFSAKLLCSTLFWGKIGVRSTPVLPKIGYKGNFRWNTFVNTIYLRCLCYLRFYSWCKGAAVFFSVPVPAMNKFVPTSYIVHRWPKPVWADSLLRLARLIREGSNCLFNSTVPSCRWAKGEANGTSMACCSLPNRCIANG